MPKEKQPRKQPDEQRDMYIIKSNDLVRKAQYDLTTSQQKLILYCISKIRPDDTPQTKYRITIPEICSVCNWKLDKGGTYYSRIKKDFEFLVQRQWCKMPDDWEGTFSWLGDIRIHKQSGIIEYTFNPNVQPYLFDVKSRYTQYKLDQILVFKNKYAIRMYEILRSYTTQQSLDNNVAREITLTLEDISALLQTSSYSEWYDFNRNILKRAIDEINEFSMDMHIDYLTVKENRVVKAVRFIITPAKATQAYLAWAHREETLQT